MKHIHVISSDSGSLGEITNDLISYLSIYYKITQENKGEIPEKFDVLLSHYINKGVTNSSLFYQFNYKILIQPIDGTVIGQEYVDAINCYDLIITPGNNGKKIMQENGVNKPIIVIPNYYKPNILLQPENLNIPKLDKHIKDKVVFYHESTCHPRKGIDILCRTFVKTFSSNYTRFPVVLIIKTAEHNRITHDYLERIKKETIALQKKYKYPARIIKISQHLDFEILKKLWYKMNCYVSFAGIEGFGIPLLRANVLGKRIFTLETILSGYSDFLIQGNTKFIKSQQTQAKKEIMPIYTPSTSWEIPKDELDCKTALWSTFIDIKYDIDNFKEHLEQPPHCYLDQYKFMNIMREYKKALINLTKEKPQNKYLFKEGDIEL